jgi:hypothetical protein
LPFNAFSACSKPLCLACSVSKIPLSVGDKAM